MRKIFAFILLAATLVTALASCNTSGNEGSTTEAPQTSSPETTAPETNAPATTPDEKIAQWKKDYEVITVEKALELCGEPGNLTTERYYIIATVASVDNAQYGQMTITDETGSIMVYGTYSADGEIGYAALEAKPYKGDVVLLHCTLQNYNGTKEVKNARLIDFVHVEVEVDTSKYTDMTVAAARDAAVATLVKVDGVVAKITYAFGQKPSGYYLVDETGSIYVYDADSAQRVKEGNTVTVLGSKTYWILEDEKAAADKFGYKGCCQLEDVTLVSNDEKTTEFNKSWIKESTVKAILDTPVSENITTNIYKVNALVKKTPGTGFTNYYFYDLDGKTGSYVYTQCNGSDFAWLDAFDGKICTVYLSVINAKSTSSSCFYRLFPVAVKDEGFKFDLANTAEHIVKYYGVGQFMSEYTGNPKTELVSTVSSDLLGFKDAKLTYTSSDESIVYFTTEGGKTVFNCGKNGKATVTVKGEYNGKAYTETVEITVSAAEAYSYISVTDAIKKPVGEIVVIKGIVGPSLVNKDGFYLIDENGIIAVTMPTDVIATLQIGNEIILEGKRDQFTKGGTDYFGQTCVTDCKVLTNYYGNHEYETKFFVTDKTLTDFYNLDPKVDYTTTVFVLKATIAVEETAHYTNINLISGETKVGLYCSSAKQYNWLKEYAGKEVTLELAACNWNSKTYYRGCVLAVRTADGKVLNTLNFNN